MTIHTEDQLQEPQAGTQSDPGETPRQNGENRPRRRIAAQAEAARKKPQRAQPNRYRNPPRNPQPWRNS